MSLLRTLAFALPFATLTVASFAACTTTTTTTTTRGDGGAEPEEPSADGGESPAADGGDGGLTPPASSDGVTLAIREVVASIDIAGTTPGAGKELVVVAIELGNTGSILPVAPTFPLFTLTTTDALTTGVELAPSTALDQACPQNTSVEKDGVLKCALVFQAKQGAAKELRYRLPTGKTLAVAVPPIPRCHTLAPAGSTVTTTAEASDFLPAPNAAVVPPPNGTYVLTAARSFGQTTQFMPWTFRITGNKIEQTQKTPAGDLVFRESGTVGVERKFASNTFFDHLLLTFGCSSPERGFPANVDLVFQYQPATQTLVLQEGLPTALELRFKKQD